MCLFRLKGLKCISLGTAVLRGVVGAPERWGPLPLRLPARLRKPRFGGLGGAGSRLLPAGSLAAGAGACFPPLLFLHRARCGLGVRSRASGRDMVSTASPVLAPPNYPALGLFAASPGGPGGGCPIWWRSFNVVGWPTLFHVSPPVLYGPAVSRSLPFLILGCGGPRGHLLTQFFSVYLGSPGGAVTWLDQVDNGFILQMGGAQCDIVVVQGGGQGVRDSQSLAMGSRQPVACSVFCS